MATGVQRLVDGAAARLTNFGRNVSFQPGVLVSPENSRQVVEYLERYRGRNLRAVGSLHSWSTAAVGEDVVLDLRRLNDVSLRIGADGSVCVEAGAGCTVDQILDYLHAHGGYTLPAYGIIGRQTVAGAMATATHGAARSSLSHFVEAVRVAAYDATGTARTYDWNQGDDLRAARCALGCMGIVLSVRLRTEDDFLIAENTVWLASIDEVLVREGDDPLQQFFLIPWSWQWFVRLRHRAASDAGPSRNASWQRIVRLVGVDIGFNGVVRLLTWTPRWSPAIRWLFRRLFPLVARSDQRVVDHSRKLLTMRNDLYVHVEMELLVPAEHVVHAASFLEWVLKACGGESLPIPPILASDRFGEDPGDALARLRGQYVHDYPITFRRVLRDDALISMTSGDEAEAWYAVSLVSYRRNREPFLAMAAFVARAMASAYRARPHWGKICPLDGQAIAALYPELPRFRARCAALDPDRVFVNRFASELLGF